MPIKGAVKPEHFSTGFDEEWKVVGKKHDGTKGYELRVVNWGELSKA